MATLGKVLKLFRLTEERTTSSVAKEIGVSHAYICYLEADKKKPTVDMLKRISDCYKIPASEFLRIEELSKDKEYNSLQTFLEVVLTWFKYHDPEYLTTKTFKSPSEI